MSFIDPTGEKGWPGFAAGAGTNFMIQMSANFRSVPNGTARDRLRLAFRCVDWSGVAIGGAVGATGLPGLKETVMSVGKWVGGGSGSIAGENAAKYFLIGLPHTYGLNSTVPDVRIGTECECKDVGLGGAIKSLF